jgi:hypothetical protein
MITPFLFFWLSGFPEKQLPIRMGSCFSCFLAFWIKKAYTSLKRETFSPQKTGAQ